MAIVWGGWNNHMRVGIDVTTTGYDTWTPAIDVHVNVYVESGNWSFGDNQSVTLTGAVGTHTFDFYNNMGKYQVRHLGTRIIYGQQQSYGGGPRYEFWATLYGNYLGGNSSVYRDFYLPPRPKRHPSPPSHAPNWTELTTQQARLTWGHPNDAGGGALIEDRLQASRNSSFTDLIHDTTMPGVSRYVTNFAPNTRYWFRAAVRSDVGWSGWSAVSEGVTPDFKVPAAPVISEIGPDAAVFNWQNPTTGGDRAGLEIHVARSADFTYDLDTHYQAQWRNDFLWTGLRPAETYYVRVRAGNPYGWGSWSATQTFETLSGAKIKLDNGTWVDGVAHVMDDGVWKEAKVYKRVNGVWVL